MDITYRILFCASILLLGSDGNPDHISPSTVKRYTSVLHSMLTMAYKFTIEETKAILTAAKIEPINIRLLIELALFTGMRRGEIVGLKWSDINFDKQCLSVNRSIYKPRGEKSIEKEPKSHSSIRTIAIQNRLCEH